MRKTRIALIGIDGSGKTTHLLILLKELRAEGLRCKHVNLRGEYFRLISFPLLLFCRLIGREGRLMVQGQRQRTRHPDFGTQSNFISFIWSSLFLLDICLLALLRGYFSIRVDSILCDRCIIDSIVDLMASFGDNKIYRKSVGRVFLSLMKPNTVVLLDLDEKEALSRRAEIAEIEYVKSRRALYREIASNLVIPMIDSSNSFSAVHERIISCIERKRPFGKLSSKV